jgi:hypothetical protein
MPFRICILLLCLIVQSSRAQQDSSKALTPRKETDLIDIAQKILKKTLIRRDTAKKTAGKVYFSGSPSPGYSLSSGWVGLVVANGAFYTDNDKAAKISNVYTDALYTQQKQTVVHLQSNIWTKGNRFNIVTDWRYYNYPQKTYGLGENTNTNNYADQTFKYVRVGQSVLKNIKPNLYAGLGYSFDYHWNIPLSPDGDPGVIAQINSYGIHSQSRSSGLIANFLFDNRLNSINPAGGSYVNIVYRDNLTALGSDNNWQSLLIDLRHYVPFPRHSENILAFWSYNWLTLTGNPPYLDLPSTGWDPYGNTGRGYIQGRFRSKNMVYLEAEYRFKISPGGLFGGVVFVNAQSFSEWPSNTFQAIAPAAGFGLRTKFNKYSRTNIAIDYGFGEGGSRGVFVNLGEVF